MIARPVSGSMMVLLVLLCGCGAADALRGRDATDEHDMSALMRAAAAGDSVAVERLLDDGADPNQRVRPHSDLRSFIAFISWMQDLPDRDDGYTALHYALREHELGIARVLLERGAAPSDDDEWLWPIAQLRGVESIRVLLDAGVMPRGGAASAVMMATAAPDTTPLALLLGAGAPVDSVRQGLTPLMLAAREGKAPAVRMLLAAGASPDLRDPKNGWTAAMLARDAGHDAIADLIGGPEDTDKLRDAELARAVTERDASAVRRLLGEGADPNTRVRMYDTVLSIAIRQPDRTITELLLNAGANPNAKTIADMTVLKEAMQLGDSALAARLIAAGGNPRTPGLATAAAAAASLPLLRLLAASGANLHEDNEQPLRSAVGRNGNADVVRFLLERGANLHAVDSNDRSVLGGAVAFQNPEIVRILLDAGANPNQAMGRWTPLMSAAISGDSALVELLLERGANPALLDDEGRNAAEIARRAGHERLAAYLRTRSSASGS